MPGSDSSGARYDFPCYFFFFAGNMVESLGLGVSGVGNESDGDGVGIDFRM